MLPKRRRLKAHEVKEVMRHGRSYRAGHLSMKFVSHTTPLQTAAVVAKATAKKAVERNRLRRALYRALLSCGELTTAKMGGKAVIFVQKVPTKDLSHVFAEDISMLFKNIH